MRRIIVIVTLVSLLAGAYVAGRIITTPVAHAAGADSQPWYASVDFINSLMQRLDHYISNDDRKTVAEETQAAEAIKQTKEMEKTNSWLQQMMECWCIPRGMPRAGGGGGDHRHNPGTDPTAVPATATPTCSGAVYRWCEDGNIIITTCDGKTFGEPWQCKICVQDDEGSAHCEVPTATSTSTPVPTPKPATATPPPLVKTPRPGCPEEPHWVCDGNGNWLWKACGVTLCTTFCTHGCSAVPGFCKTSITDPTVEPTAVLTVIHDCSYDGGKTFVPCHTSTSTPGNGPSATSTRTSTPGHGPTLTRTATSAPNPTDVPPTSPPATLPIATKTPTPEGRVPTATLTGPPIPTPGGLCTWTADMVSKLISVDEEVHVDPLDEHCGFKWNGKFVGETRPPVRCTRRMKCTLDILGTTVKNMYVAKGKYLVDGNATPDWTFLILAGTFRMEEGYPAGDAVHNRCTLLMKERGWGLDFRQGKLFDVWPFGFSCSDADLITLKSGHVCPALVSNGVSYNTYPLLVEGPESNGCKLPSQTDQRVGYVPDGWTLYDGSLHESGDFWQGYEATLRLKQ